MTRWVKAYRPKISRLKIRRWACLNSSPATWGLLTSAICRLGEMVETAVRLARAAHTVSAEAGEDPAESKTLIPTEGTGEHRADPALASSVLDASVLDDEPVLEV